MWVGGVADSQTRSKPFNKKKLKSPRKSLFSTQISPFIFPNLTKILGWVGATHWVGSLMWENLPNFFLDNFPQ